MAKMLPSPNEIRRPAPTRQMAAGKKESGARAHWNVCPIGRKRSRKDLKLFRGKAKGFD